MTLRHGSVYGIVKCDWVCSTRSYGYSLNEDFPKNKDDTYLFIFGPSQEVLLEYLINNIESINGKIIYKSDKAYNKNYPDSGPRNTLVILEFDE